MKSKKVQTWLKDELLSKATNNPMIPGINGIKVFDGKLYASNTEARKFLQIGIADNGTAVGDLKVLEENLNIDDFAFDSEGSAYLTTHVFQSVIKLQRNGTRSRIAGGADDKICAGTTAAAFGRTADDRNTLYVTATGGMSTPVGGEIAPARLLKIDVGNRGVLV